MRLKEMKQLTPLGSGKPYLQCNYEVLVTINHHTQNFSFFI